MTMVESLGITHSRWTICDGCDVSNTGGSDRPLGPVGTRRLALLGAIVGGLVLSAALPAAGQEEKRVWQGTVVARSLNVRGGPGGGFAIVDKLKRGAAIEAIDQDGRWVRLRRDEPAWVHRSFVELPEDFMAPEFTKEENAFLDWVGERDDLEELSVEGEGRLSLVLVRDPQRRQTDIQAIAETVGCAYRDQAGYPGTVTVTVWPEDGPAAGWILQATCP